MIVITADQINSRNNGDLTGAMRDALQQRFGDRLPLAVDRTAGDELQLLTRDGASTLDIVLELTRQNSWSIGLGFGQIEEPLPTTPRAGRGTAFIAARKAVQRAKRKPSRLALHEAAPTQESTAVADAEALLDLLILRVASRSPRGWELHDLLAEGLSQAEAAERLGISPQAVSDRAAAADLAAVDVARPAYARILDRLIHAASVEPGKKEQS